MRYKHTLFLCYAAIIAALYFVLTLLCSALGISSGVIQIRLSEMLCILPIFASSAIPGLTVGCFFSNLYAGAIWQDYMFGSLATLIGAIGARALRRFPALAPLPTVLANMLIIPFVLSYGYGVPDGIPFMMLTVGIGELISAYILGYILYRALKSRAGFLEL